MQIGFLHVYPYCFVHGGVYSEGNICIYVDVVVECLMLIYCSRKKLHSKFLYLVCRLSGVFTTFFIKVALSPCSYLLP